jgi:alpha(1,3/1,4) fucosyltransferase
MSALRVACADFWPGFEPPELLVRFPELAEVAGVELVPEPARADLVVFSTFVDGRKVARPRDPRAAFGARGTRLFYTAENVRPDFATCDFALSFCRELVDARHLRVPNFVGTQRVHGYADGALLHPHADPAAARRAKTRFCAYVQGNRVRQREEFVQQLARYKRVDCAGPSLNNAGFVADRRQKYELYRASKFAVTFENEVAVGYTTEKLPDALLAHCVPIYWGDPTVRLDFDPACFLHLRDFPSAEALVERIAELDQDDAAYERLLGARRLPGGVLPTHADPAVLRAFFARVAEAARRATRSASAARG